MLCTKLMDLEGDESRAKLSTFLQRDQIGNMIVRSLNFCLPKIASY